MIWFLTILIFVSIAGNLYFLTIIKQNNMGAINETISGFVGRINNATNEVAKDIANWKAAFQSNNVTEEILADMDAKIAVLEALGAEDSPVPDAPAEEGGEETTNGEPV